MLNRECQGRRMEFEQKLEWESKNGGFRREKFIYYCLMEDIEENRVSWTSEEEDMVFMLQKEYGNKWSTIAMKMPGRNENSVKNKFYSTLRKGLRKMNKYIGNIRRKSHKQDLSNNKVLKPDFLTKLTAIADRNFEQKYEVRPKAVESSQQIQEKLILLARNPQTYDFSSQETYSFEETLLHLILLFKKHCKKRKGKRKVRFNGNLSSSEGNLSEVLSGGGEASIFEQQEVSKVHCGKIQNKNAGRREQNLGVSQSMLLDPLRKGFQLLPQAQEVRQQEVPQNIIKKSLSLEESIPNYYNNQYSMTTSSYFSRNYSLLHMIDSSPMINNYSSFNNSLLSNLNKVEISRPYSHSTDPRNSQNPENQMFFMSQIPYMVPKTEGMLFWDGFETGREGGMPLDDPQRWSTKKLSSSEVFKKTPDVNNQPLMMKSQSFQSSKTLPFMKNQPTSYSTKVIEENPEPTSKELQ